MESIRERMTSQESLGRQNTYPNELSQAINFFNHSRYNLWSGTYFYINT